MEHPDRHAGCNIWRSRRAQGWGVKCSKWKTVGQWFSFTKGSKPTVCNFLSSCALVWYYTYLKPPEVHKYYFKGIEKFKSKVICLMFWLLLNIQARCSLCMSQELVPSQCSLEVNKIELSGARKSRKFSSWSHFWSSWGVIKAASANKPWETW